MDEQSLAVLTGARPSIPLAKIGSALDLSGVGLAFPHGSDSVKEAIV